MKRLLSTLAFFLFLPLSAIEYMPQIHQYITPETLGEACAREIADLIRTNQQAGKRTVLGLATGSTPLPLYEALIRIVEEEKLDLSNVITFNLDEYVGLLPEHPESYRSFMFEHLFSHLPGIKKEHIHIPNTYAKTEKDLSSHELRGLHRTFSHRKKSPTLTEEEQSWILKQRAIAYDTLIEKYGPIDIQILGIGTNGHIGFVEPGTSFEEGTSVVKLTENTRKDNARFFKGDVNAVPEYAITMGVKTILGAKKIFMLATGAHKAEMIHELLSESISSHVPATSLRLHQNVELFVDSAAASKVKLSKLIARFYHGKVLREHRFEKGELWTCGGKIVAPHEQADIEIDVGGLFIAPGYIDLQINGGFGVDFSVHPKRAEEVAKKLPQYGVTAFLPTVISSNKDQYQHILSCLRPFVMKPNQGAKILGIHLEGPFLNPQKHNAHNRDFICSTEEIDSPTDVYGDLTGVKIVTLAPEIKGAEKIIEFLKEKGIIVSAGHSMASCQEMEKAIEKGVSFATHLYSAMGTFHHRDPGIIGTILTTPDLYFSLIADPEHLHPQAVNLAWRSRGDGLVLVSDAMAALGLTSGVYRLGTQEVEVLHERAVIKGTNTLAGSVIGLDKAVRYLHDSTGCCMSEAIEAASYRPAVVLGIEKVKGALHEGADADFNLLDKELNVHACYIGGENYFTISK